ncbi:hypothetical protein [Shewanella indica]|uniref:hypothetical protein n=1 Tax=Shewanella indica TaxID=768528 RepID=UPI001CFEF5E0|nr:hypothetical protein [Shewanella indica]
MTIQYQAEYIRFIVSRGVGSNDRVASSVDSYLSYLRSVSHHLNIDISPETLSSERDVQRLANELEGVRRPRTIGNYVSAMRQYVAMVDELGLASNQYQSLVNAPDEGTVQGDSESHRTEHVAYQGVELVADIDDDELDSEPAEEFQEEANPDDKHFLHSSFREKLLEHLFVAELLKRSWLEHSCELEIAKPEVDSKGYDLIAENKGMVRHIQLKATKRGGNAAAQNIHMALGTKPSGCVVWIEFDEQTLEMGPYRFFGADAGYKLPSLEDYPVAKHTKANAEGKKTLRPQLRKVSKSQFQLIETTDELYRTLFG